MTADAIARRALNLVGEVRSGETATTLLMALNGFVLLMAYSCIKPVREALILAHPGGAEYRAYAAGATAIILLVAVPAYSRVSARLSRNHLIVGTTAFFTTHLLAFYAFGSAMGTSLPFAVGFYLWIAIFNMMIVAQFWAFANDLYTEEAGRRIFPLLGFGVSLGAVAGAAAARIVIADVGAMQMMPVAAGVLATSAVLSQWIHAREVRAARTIAARVAATAVVGGRAGDAFRAVLNDRYLLYIAGFSLLFTLVKTNGDYVLARAVEDAANLAVSQGTLPPSHVQNYIGEVFANITFWVNVISLALQGLVVSRVVKYLGFGAAFCVLPVLALGDAMLMTAWPVLAAVRIGKTAESATDYSLNNTVRNMLWLPTSRQAKYLAKQATDTFFVRAGDISSAGIIFLAAQLELPLRAVAFSNVILVVAWLVLAKAILREREALLQATDSTRGRQPLAQLAGGRAPSRRTPLPLKEPPVQTFLQILRLGRGRLRSFFVVAVMVSVGTGATLCEPWIYRAIIDDIAGVFVPSPAVVEVETAIENAARSVEHWSGALDRILSIPMAPFEVTDSNRRTLDARHPHEAAATIILGAILLVVIRLVAEAFKRLADNRATSLAIELERDFILRTFKHVIYLPLTFFSKRASGVVARQIDQSDNVAPIFTAVAKELWPDLFRLLAILAIMLTVNYELALVATLTVLLYGVISWRLTRVIERDAEQYYGLWDEVASRVQQAIAGIKTVRTHSTERYEETRIHQAASDAYSSYMRRTRAENRYSYLQDGVISLSKACVLGVGGLKAIEHQLTPGDVVMFLAYLDRLFAPIEGLTSLYTALQQHVISVRRAQRLLDEPVTGDESRPSLQVAEGTVRFENVHFAYSPDRPVLDGVSFELRAGQRTALIGPSGAGKTTVTDLLTALYRPQDGEIFIDNQPLSQVSPPSIRSAVRGVAADEMIFRMSIGENIRYGRHDASLDEVREAVRLAGLAPVIERLPEGLDTVIGEQGVELSLGERQRVLLARAFVARPLILILDEATANLDFRTEASVKHALEVISKGRTTLIVAHRRSMLTSVDRVLVLRGGKIEQDGTPADLMTREGYFRDMMSADEHSAA